MSMPPRRARKPRKKKRAEEAAALGAAGGALGGDVMRGEEDMPLEPPSMWGRGAVEAIGGDMGGALGGLDSVAELGGSPSLGGLGDGAGEVKERKLAAPKFDPEASVACYTRFESMHTPHHLVQRISRVLDRFHGAGYSLEDDKYKLKASVLTPVGNVVFTAQVFIDDSATDSAPVSVVEFRRRTGDSMHYLNLFNELRDSLADVIMTKSTAATAVSPAAIAAI